MTEKEELLSSALIVAGQMLALEAVQTFTLDTKVKNELIELAKKLDIETLEEFLDHPTPDFMYTLECRRTIKLAQYLRMKYGNK